MVNLLHLCETMTTEWVNESDIRVPIDVFEKFAIRNNFIIKRKQDKYKNYKYKLLRKSIPVYFISGEEINEFKFMDISDIHIGHKDFNESALREKLKYALENDIQQVFIAGDVFEGACSVGQDILYCSQIDLAYNIFKDYPLTYYVINGNHDYSFEQCGFPNPLRMLANRLQDIGISFNYFDVYLMDFVICGVIKRVMHVERQDFNKKRIFAALKVKMFEEDNLLTNTYNNVEYPVRFFQVGHIHVNVQMFYSRKRVYISQSGSFLKSFNEDDRANIIQGKVIEQKIFMN